MRKFLIPFLSVLVLAASCEKTQTVDNREFELYYMGITGLHPGDNAAVSPSYIGAPATDFRIYDITRNGIQYYSPKLDGELGPEDTFTVDKQTGTFKVQKTSALKDGKYVVGISCVSSGKTYEYPEAVTVNVLKAE